MARPKAATVSFMPERKAAPAVSQAGIVIEKGVPTPGSKQSGITAVMRAMKVGDSIVVPLARRGGMYGIATNIGIRVMVRKVSAESIRVWRTA